MSSAPYIMAFGPSLLKSLDGTNGMTPDQTVKISKFLSFVLRHRPQRIGLKLDHAGWAVISDLIEAAARTGMTLSEEDIRDVVDKNDKKRFSISEDGLRIRASQGHSIPVDLGLEPVAPPVFLYHGTAARFVASILKEGLKRRRRHHVHLSPDEGTAMKVGQRHGRPVVLRIKAREMNAHGVEFYLSDNGVWLVDHVSPEHIECLDEEL